MTITPYPVVIYSNYKEVTAPVIGVDGERAQIEFQGKLVTLSKDANFAPKLAKMFAPGSVQIAEGQVRSRILETKSLEGVKMGPPIDEGEEFSATITPSMSYRDCYIAVVYFDGRFLFGATGQPSAGVFFHQIGDLEAGKEKMVKVELGRRVPMNMRQYLTFFYLVFAQGLEIHSNLDRMPYSYFRMVDLARHRQIMALYLAKNPKSDLAAQPYLMVPPLLPPEINPAALPGSVVVTIGIGEDGTVEGGIEFETALPPSVIPAIGNALANWLFLPTLKDGHPIKATVKIPITLHK